MTDKNVDEAKGKAKEAGGSLTGDDSTKREGKVDQAKSTAKDTVDEADQKVEDAADKVTGD